jgi:hypothetical protein
MKTKFLICCLIIAGLPFSTTAQAHQINSGKTTQIGENKRNSRLCDLAEDALARGEYRQAEKNAKVALREAKSLASDPLTECSCLLILAACCLEQGNPKRATPYMEQAKLLLVSSQDNLKQAIAEVCQEQPASANDGRPGQLLAGSAANFEEIADLLCASGDIDQGIEFYKLALNSKLQTLEPDGLALAHTMLKLARQYSAQGDYTEADSYYKQALEIREKKLGLNHMAVASVLESYAELLKKTGNEAEAQVMLIQVALIRGKLRF